MTLIFSRLIHCWIWKHNKWVPIVWKKLNNTKRWKIFEKGKNTGLWTWKLYFLLLWRVSGVTRESSGRPKTRPIKFNYRLLLTTSGSFRPNGRLPSISSSICPSICPFTVLFLLLLPCFFSHCHYGNNICQVISLKVIFFHGNFRSFCYFLFVFERPSLTTRKVPEIAWMKMGWCWRNFK